MKPLGRPSNLLGRQPLGKAVVAGLLGLGKLGLCTLAPTGWLLAGVATRAPNNNQVCNQLAGSLLGQRGLLGLAGAHPPAPTPTPMQCTQKRIESRRIESRPVCFDPRATPNQTKENTPPTRILRLKKKSRDFW